MGRPPAYVGVGIVVTLLCAAWLASCVRSSGGAGAPPAASAQGDASPQPEQCPRTRPEGRCNVHWTVECTFGTTHCRCLPYMGGALPEREPPDTWRCEQRDRRCPAKPPRSGSACRGRGLVCNYSLSINSPRRATCEQGAWRIRSEEPDP